MIEEELKLLKELQPVMGLTDTLKAKNLFTIRKQLIQKAYNEYGAKNNKEPFDFSEILNKSEKDLSKSWKSITEKDIEANQTFPIIDIKKIDALRTDINKDLKSFMRENYPSLKEDL